MAEEMQGDAQLVFDLTPMAMAEWTGFFRGLHVSLNMATKADPTPDPYLDGLRELVLINKEEPTSRYMSENAERLRQNAINKMRGEDATKTGPSDAGPLALAMERLTTALERQANSIGSTVDEASSSVPTFRAATKIYLDTRIAANGGKESGDIRSIRGRADLFATLMGDKLINEYGAPDLQSYLNQLQYWPPERDDVEEFRGKTASEILAMNEKHQFGVLARNTVSGHYLADIKAITALAAANAGIADPFAGARLFYPSIFKEPKRRKAPAISKVAKAFHLGVESGELHKALILPLGFWTGRRIGLLTRLQGPNIRRVGDYVVASLDQHFRSADGALENNGYKTAASLDGFIMHRFFDEIGFVEWAMRQPGFIFERMNECEDPEDAMQKAANKLLKEAETGGSYHGFRHQCTTRMRDAGVTEYSRRVQGGHSRRDTHEDYGDLVVDPNDAPLLANLPFPDGFDPSIFRGLDFDAFARA
jgi:integrase